jgi:hypothetical protein
MSITALSLITDTLLDLGVLAAEETPSNAEAQDCLRRLNRMIDVWGTQRLTMHTILRTYKVIATNTASYTIGSGGDINIVRPVSLQQGGAKLVLDTSATDQTEVVLGVLTEPQWAAISQKTMTSSIIRAISYDYAWTAGLGRIKFWPVPNVGTMALVLYTPLALTAFADLTTSYTFAPGYEEALQDNLTLRCAPMFGKPVTPEMRERATTSLGHIKRANIRPQEMSIDAAAFMGHGHSSVGADGGVGVDDPWVESGWVQD